jgi:hypothetical protein
MNERLPDSTRLPLRAMVMVLLFLGLIFLLVGFQAMSSGNDASDDSTPVTMTTTKPAPPKPDVRVYNAGGDEAAATRVGDRLREAGWNVTEAGAPTPVEVQVPATTVYFGAADGEQAAADSVGKILEAPVEARFPEIAEQPPGVIVLVTG